jgi:hypothetical protein
MFQAAATPCSFVCAILLALSMVEGEMIVVAPEIRRHVSGTDKEDRKKSSVKSR